MTDAPRVEPLSFDRIEQVAEAIRAHGGRVSAAGRLVLEALFDAEGPVSAEWIAADLERRGQAPELTSVYRNLERYEALGVLRHVHLGHGPGLYSLIGRGEREYLSCERCNRVTSVEPDRLDAIRELIRKQFGYETRFTHFPIIGLCPDCAAAASGHPANRGETAMTDHDSKDSAHTHDDPHAHEHSHGGETHSHPHVAHEHEHTEHEHEHNHGDLVHSHPHVHQEGLEDADEHAHEHTGEATG